MSANSPDQYASTTSETSQLSPDLQQVAAELAHYNTLYPRQRTPDATAVVSSAVETHQTQLYEALHNPSTAAEVIALVNDSYHLTFRPTKLDTIAKDFYLDNFQTILSYLEDFDDPTAIAHACEALRRGIEPIERYKEIDHASTERAQQLSAIDSLINFAPAFMRQYPERSQMLPLAAVYNYGALEQKNSLTRMGVELMLESQADIAHLGISLLPMAVSYSSAEDRRAYIEPAVETLIARHGITPEVATKAWLTERAEHNYAETLANNLAVMQQLEALRPGMKICETLYRDFGILNFADRPFDVLVRQFDQRDESGPYILMTFPGFDGTRSYSASHETVEREYLKVVAQAESKGFHVRMTETRTKDDLKHLQKTMSERYGAITHWNIHSHGDGKTLVLSEGYAKNPLDGYVRTADIPEVIQRSRLGLSPRINVMSCSGGMEEGVAQAVHTHTGAIVLSPTRTAEMNTMDFLETEPGVFDWSITYQLGMDDVRIARFAND